MLGAFQARRSSRLGEFGEAVLDAARSAHGALPHDDEIGA